MRVGSLFAGVGGFDLGFERAGMQTAWQVEIDEKCREVLARRFPGAKQYEDVREVGRHNIEPVDVVCGGFPCQDLSVAGKRAGMAGARSGLFYEMVRVVDELQPAWLVWENVPGLLSSARGADFAAVLVALERIGYHGGWTTLDARYFGVAQRRRRVFGVFTRLDSGARRAAEVLALFARLRGNPAPSREAREGASTASLCGTGSGGPDDNDGQANRIVANAVSASAGHHGHSSPRGDGSDNLVTPALQAGSPTYERGDGSPFCVPTVAWALQERDAKDSDSDTKDGHLIPVLMRQREGKPGGGKGPLLSEDVSLSRAANGNDQALFPAQGVRRLTPTECERLQGFPDGWTEGHADSHRYRMMGNAVAVPCAEWIGRRLKAAVTPQESGGER